MALGNASMMRLNEPNTQCVSASFTGGGAATAWTKVDGDGISAVTYNAATGKFKVTFNDVGVSILAAWGTVNRAAGSAPLIINFVPSTLSQTAKTVDIEVWDLATPSLVDPANTTTAYLFVIFKKTT